MATIKPNSGVFVCPALNKRQNRSTHTIVLHMSTFSKQRCTLSFAGISLVFVGLSLLVKLAGSIWIHKQISHLTREYSE